MNIFQHVLFLLRNVLAQDLDDNPRIDSISILQRVHTNILALEWFLNSLVWCPISFDCLPTPRWIFLWSLSILFFCRTNRSMLSHSSDQSNARVEMHRCLGGGWMRFFWFPLSSLLKNAGTRLKVLSDVGIGQQSMPVEWLQLFQWTLLFHRHRGRPCLTLLSLTACIFYVVTVQVVLFPVSFSRHVANRFLVTAVWQHARAAACAASIMETKHKKEGVERLKSGPEIR